MKPVLRVVAAVCLLAFCGTPLWAQTRLPAPSTDAGTLDAPHAPAVLSPEVAAFAAAIAATADITVRAKAPKAKVKPEPQPTAADDQDGNATASSGTGLTSSNVILITVSGFLSWSILLSLFWEEPASNLASFLGAGSLLTGFMGSNWLAIWLTEHFGPVNAATLAEAKLLACFLTSCLVIVLSVAGQHVYKWASPPAKPTSKSRKRK